jgi:hypothetical protein
MHVEKLLPYIFFTTTLMIGALIFKDYGVGIDEYINRDNGIVSLNYILSLLERYLSITIWALDPQLNSNLPDLSTYKDRDYGVAFDLPAIIIERILSLNSSREQYLLRHLLTYFTFWISTIYFYNLINNQFKSKAIALLAVLMLYLSPRIFAEAFYNNKDLVFLSIFLIATYYLIEVFRKSSKINTLLFAIFSGLSIDLRIIAVILPGLFFLIVCLKLYNNIVSKKEALHHTLIYAVSCLVCILLFWPWLWADPITNFLTAFQNMAKFRWLNWVLYRDHYYPSSDLPWHYLPIWILITTPPIYIALILVGQIKCAFFVSTNKVKDILSTGNVSIFIMTVICVAPISAAIILKSTVYDAWRQFYFIYPALLFFAALGTNLIFSWIRKIKLLKFCFILLLCFSQVSIIYWMVNAHPFQNVYFNSFAGPNWDQRYEVDYWGLSNGRGVEFILSDTTSDRIKIYGLGITSIPQAFSLLPAHQQQRLEVTTDINTANYVLTNFRLANNPNYISLLNHIESLYLTSFSIIVSGKPVLKIFRLPNP